MTRSVGLWPHLPNAITCARVAMVPVVLVLLLGHPQGSLAAAAVFALAAASDALDGHLARAHDLVSNFGKIVDPLADKLLVGSVLIALAALDRLPEWVVAVVLLRELGVSGMRLMAARQGAILPARVLGKLKMALQVLVVALFIGVPDAQAPALLAMLYAMVAVTIASGVEAAAACRTALSPSVRFSS